MKRILITGGAGFIGSHIVDKLVESDNELIIFDNLSSGKYEFISKHKKNNKMALIVDDLLNKNSIISACKDVDTVYHLAANPDVRLGAVDTKIHFEQNITATYNLLEAMRINKVKNIVFASTSAVYGNTNIKIVDESYGPLMPESLYGASKLACEALISAYCNSFNMNAYIFRFANIVGIRSTHGIVPDFISKLKASSNELEVLGNGMQEKSYLHVTDCVDAIMLGVANSYNGVHILNISAKDTINATEIAKIVIDKINVNDVIIIYTGGKQGWIGDVPKIQLAIEKIEKLGWSPKYNSQESIMLSI